jgi:hypothetical protein
MRNPQKVIPNQVEHRRSFKQRQRAGLVQENPKPGDAPMRVLPLPQKDEPKKTLAERLGMQIAKPKGPPTVVTPDDTKPATEQTVEATVVADRTPEPSIFDVQPQRGDILRAPEPVATTGKPVEAVNIDPLTGQSISD